MPRSSSAPRRRRAVVSAGFLAIALMPAAVPAAASAADTGSLSSWGSSVESYVSQVAGAGRGRGFPVPSEAQDAACAESAAALRDCYSDGAAWATKAIAFLQLRGLSDGQIGAMPAIPETESASEVRQQLRESRAQWLTVVRAALRNPLGRVPVTVSFSRPVTAVELGRIGSSVRASVPSSILSRFQTPTRVITTANGDESDALQGQPVGTAAAITAAANAASTSTLADIDETVASLLVSTSDAREIAAAHPEDLDDADDVTGFEAQLADYQRLRSAINGGDPTFTSVSVTASPLALIAAAVLRPHIVASAAVLGDDVSAPAVTGAADVAPAAIAVAEEVNGTRLSQHASRRHQDPKAKRAADETDWAKRWAPSRYTLRSGLYEAPRSDGLHKKKISFSAKWTAPGSLDRYRDSGHPTGLEMQAFPTESRLNHELLWSEGWKSNFIGQNKKWHSDLPDAYLDDITYDLGGGPLGAPDLGHAKFAIGVPSPKKLKPKVNYIGWYVTDYGEQDTGHVQLVPELTTKDKTGLGQRGYCWIAGQRRNSGCFFHKAEGTVEPDLPLRHSAHYVCALRQDIICQRDSHRDQVGERAEYDPPGGGGGSGGGTGYYDENGNYVCSDEDWRTGYCWIS